jgi:hypothetical protein
MAAVAKGYALKEAAKVHLESRGAEATDREVEVLPAAISKRAKGEGRL